MDTSYFSVLSLSFGLGLLHALDADHVMAMTTLSNERPGFFTTLRFCICWALGHGGVLMLVTGLAVGFGLHMSPMLQQSAELAVGVVLIGLGLWCFWRFKRERLVLIEHRHGDVTHRHWCKEDGCKEDRCKEDKQVLTQHERQSPAQAHAPVLVGVLHGLAGSAPALALIPTMTQGKLIVAVLYMALFSMGVLLAMVGFGLGWGGVQQFLRMRWRYFFEWNRRVVAVASMLMGIYWIAQVF
jgi:cytochrome c biogenesis protein CcdA